MWKSIYTIYRCTEQMTVRCFCKTNKTNTDKTNL